MGDDNELGLVGDGAHVAGEADHVGVIQGGVNLVHDAEGRGVDLQNSEVQGDGHHRLLPAGEGLQGLHGLPRRLGLDVDAAVQHMLRVLQLQPGLAPAEEVPEGVPEGLVDELELPGEDAGHLPGQILDDPHQLPLGLLHVVPLAGEVGVAGVDPVEVLDGLQVHVAKAPDLPLQLVDAAVGLWHALQLDALGHGGGVAELVGLPELVQELLLLPLAGGELLLQAGYLPLRGQDGVVAGLDPGAHGAPLLLQQELCLPEGRQAVLAALAPQPQGGRRLGPPVDLSLRGLDGGAVLLQPALAGQAVPLHVPADLLHVRQGLGGGLLLCGQGGELLLPGADVLAELSGEGQQIRLACQLLLHLGPEGGGLGVLPGNFPASLLHLPAAVRHALVQGLALPLQALPAPLQALQGGPVVVRLALELQHCVLGGPALALGHLHLVPGGGQLPGGLLLLPLGGGRLLLQGPLLLPQALQLVGPGENARRAGHAAAGHGAAPVDDLPVQGDDAEAVLVFSRHGDAAVQVLHHHGAAQQIAENALIFAVVADEPGGDAHEAELALHPPLPQLLAPDGGERQEGGPAAVPLLEELDGALGVLLPVHHDVLQAGPQGDLQGHGAAALHLHQVRHRAVDAPEGVPLRGLHHHPHGLVEALVLLLHLREETDPGIQVVPLHGQLEVGLVGGLLPLLAALHPQGVALDDVVRGGGLVLSLLQLPLHSAAVPPGCVVLGLQALQLLIHRPPALLHLLHGGGQGGEPGPSVGGGGHRQSLPGPEALGLLSGAARAPGRLSRLLQQDLQLPLQVAGPAGDVLDAAALIRHLLPDGLAAAVLVRHLPLQHVDGGAVVLDGAPEHRRGAVLVGGPGL